MDKLLGEIQFLSELEKMKSIFRRNEMLDHSGRHEDDAQHSWHIAMYAMTLRNYALPGCDWQRAVQMTLVHDLVEIYAGDTYAYDPIGSRDKAERELAAADKIFGIPEPEVGKYMRELWEEFEACASNTAKYAVAMDRLQSLINNYQNDGAVWRENMITAVQVMERNKVVCEALPELEPFIRELIADAHNRGWLI